MVTSIAMTTDERFMAAALAEARKGVGLTSPNPAVGAVLVRAGRIVGRGFHRHAGSPHAEVVAIGQAGKRARGATLYTTLEPCNHHGRTPPCCDAILAAGVRRVVVASDDPNPAVLGGGVRRLRKNGVKVERGVLREEADALNRAWFFCVTEGRPYVTLKVAISADGKLAAADGGSRWISSPQSRRKAHALRAEADAILVGATTVSRDDPRLTARIKGARSPLRVVLDGKGRTSPKARALRPPALLLTARNLAARYRGIEVAQLPGKRGKPNEIDLRRALQLLARRGVVNLLVEGGASVLTQFLELGLWNRLVIFVSPKILGASAKGWFLADLGHSMRQARDLGAFRVRASGPDALLIVERQDRRAL
jgi:diaminohydroxyphosphoribosylaminopyrimidine deaminase/5-amino-6-(5-phosphoribosylamino)uracil reductase